MKILLVTLLIALSTFINAQSLKCYYCGKSIESSYTTVDGHTFHPGHFICSLCEKPINGKFTKNDGNYYHWECFVENKVEKCAVCGKPLQGQIHIDAFLNKYHSEHQGDFDKCSNCGRLICPALTNGGKSYGDTRSMCNICYKDAVFSDRDYNRLLKTVIISLGDAGLDLPSDNISIQGVNFYELKRQAGSKGDHQDLRGFCKSEKLSTSNGRATTSTYRHTIYVLNGMPSITTSEVIAHELMHAWIFSNTNKEPNPLECEGSCNFLSYLYLQLSGDSNASLNISRLEQNTDPIYGRGFRDIRDRFGKKPLTSLLDYLKKL